MLYPKVNRRLNGFVIWIVFGLFNLWSGGTSTLSAQTFEGIQNSNFAGVHSVYSNPALLTSMAYKRHANISTLGFEVNNNMFVLTAPFTLWQAITGNVPAQYKNANGKVYWRKDFLNQQPIGTDGWGSLSAEFRGPAYANRIGKRLVWSTHSRTRTQVSVRNVSNGLLDYGRVLFDTSMRGTNWNLDQRSPLPFSLQANAYQELGLSLAATIVDSKKLKISIGGTAKYLMGLGHYSIMSEGMQLRTYGRDSMQIMKSNVQVSYSETQVFKRIFSGLLGGLPSFRNIMGNGLGFDLGFSVEGGKGGGTAQIKERWLGDPTVRNYHWRLAASVTDFGNLNYGSEVNTFSFSNTSTVTLKTDSAFFGAFQQGGSGGYKYLEEFAKKNMNYKQENGNVRFVLPTQLHVQGDLRIMAGFYTAFHWQQSLLSLKSVGFRQPSSLVIVPRLETKWLEVSMPVGLTNDYRKGNIGACVRVGPIFLGSDNFLSNMMSNNIKGMNVYFGLSSSIGKLKK
jgi:hypothetical protein